jgi:ribosome-associated translation inhibitor RaiA
MTRRSAASVPDIEVVAGADIPAGARAEAKAKIAALGRYTEEPILHCRVRLSRSHDPAVARPVIAQGNLDVNGRLLRVQVAADNAYEALALLETRLRRKLGQMARHWEARRGAMP